MNRVNVKKEYVVCYRLPVAPRTCVRGERTLFAWSVHHARMLTLEAHPRAEIVSVCRIGT